MQLDLYSRAVMAGIDLIADFSPTERPCIFFWYNKMILNSPSAAISLTSVITGTCEKIISNGIVGVLWASDSNLNNRDHSQHAGPLTWSYRESGISPTPCATRSQTESHRLCSE